MSYEGRSIDFFLMTHILRQKYVSFFNLVSIELLIFRLNCLKFFDNFQILEVSDVLEIGVYLCDNFTAGAKSSSIKLIP